MKDLVLYPKGPNTWLGKSSIMLMGREKFVDLTLGKGNTFRCKPNVLILRGIFKGSINGNVVRPRKLKEAISMKSVSAEKEGDGRIFFIKFRRPKVKNLLGHLISKDRSKSSAHNGLIALKKVIAVGGRNNRGVKMSAENLGLASGMPHVNNLPRTSKSNLMFSKLM